MQLRFEFDAAAYLTRDGGFIEELMEAAEKAGTTDAEPSPAGPVR